MSRYPGSMPDVSATQQMHDATAAASSSNSTASAFLRLPLEIRREILSALHGSRLVHIRLALGDTMSERWRHVVCQHTNSKHLRAEQVRSLTAPKTSDDWEPQHHRCKWETYYDPDLRESSNYWDHERMHLTILRCCRQVYTEANQILWSTNTFSIHNHHTLKQFMAERTETQKGFIRHLRLRLDMTQKYRIHFQRTFQNPELIYSLTGLYHLTLVLVEDFPIRLAPMKTLTGKSLTECGENLLDAGLAPLSLLPLKTVEIEVLSPESPTEDVDQGWKKDYAQSIRDCLLGRSSQSRPDD